MAILRRYLQYFGVFDKCTRMGWASAFTIPAVLVVGGLLTWLTVTQSDREMREDLIQQAQLVQRAINVERVKELTGTEADLTTPTYLRFKESLAVVRATNPLCGRVYLVGRKSDGALFVFLDSEEARSKRGSLGGQLYTEVPPGLLRAFAGRTAGSEGPYTDRWGKWITAMVPILDPKTALFGLATPDDARSMVRKAAAFYHEHGRERLLEEINNPQGKFNQGDLYAFVYDRNMTWLAHPVKPELVGQNWIDKKDWLGGKFFRREIQEVALKNGHGWVEFEYENPLNKQHDHKTTYVERFDDLIVCAGAYQGDGEIAAMLCMDIDASQWTSRLSKAALPPILLTLVVTLVLLIGAALSARRARIVGKPPVWMLYLRPGVVGAVGVSLTCFASWFGNERETQLRTEAFGQLADSRTEIVAQSIRTLRDTELESLARIHAGTQSVSADEFQLFTGYLTKNPAIAAWEWIPVVPAAEKAAFEASARAEGMKGFEIWENGSQGKRIPAFGRLVYYPVFRVAPFEENAGALGYDLGSESTRRGALEEALRIGQPTITNPIKLVQDGGNQKAMLIFRPVFSASGLKQLRGFAVAVLKMKNLLSRGATSDNTAILELTFLRKDEAPEPLASFLDADERTVAGLAVTRPVFAFGRVFGVTAYAGPRFMQMHPKRAGWMSVLIGLVLTGSLTVAVQVALRRHEELEAQVAERTRALQQSEQSYRNQFVGNSSMMMLVDVEDGAIIDANSAAVSFYGYEREKLLALRITDINTLPVAEMQLVLTSVPEGSGKQYEFRHRLASGSVRDVAVSLSRIQFGGRTVLHSIIQDVTERKRAEETIKKLLLAVEQSPVSVVITDTSGAIEYANAKFTRTTGYTLAEVVGKNPRILKSGKLPAEIYENLWTTISAGDVWQGELLNKKKNGDLYWELATISPVLDLRGATTSFVAVKEDITERKLTEAKLVDTNRRLIEATAKAKDMALQAKKADQAKGAFLANMSHEIRTPMNAVIGMSQLLLGTSLDSTQERYAQIVRSNAESLLRLLCDILDFSKIEAGKLELENAEFDLLQWAKDFSVAPALQAETKGLLFRCQIDPDVPVHLRGDSSRLRQVLVNLTTNALKFTSAGEVVVRVSVADERAGYIVLRFAVRDTGIGIPADKRSVLFQSFSQIDASITRKFGGTGLGLAISKQLAELMSGEIGVESTEGLGSEFWFTARLERVIASHHSFVQEKIAPAAVEVVGSNDRFRILLAEDVHTNQEVAIGMLKALGFTQVDVAGNGVEALKAMEAKPYDLVFMDVQMPVMDGFDATRRIRDPRSGVRDRHIPIIAMTAHAMQGDREKCLDAGMNDVVTKPIMPEVLRVVINKWIHRAVGGAGRVVGAQVSSVGVVLENQACIFNQEVFLGRMFHDAELARAIVGGFLTETAGFLDELEAQLKAGNIPAGVAIAHGVAGSSANVNGEAFYRAAREIERAGKAGDLDGMRAAMLEMRREFSRLDGVLKKEILDERAG